MPVADPLAALAAIPREHIPAAIATLAARAMTPTEASDLDDVLTPTQLAKLLHQNVRWVYKHAKTLGGLRVSRRKLIFRRSVVERRLKGKQL
jgi:hypothetical protein